MSELLFQDHLRCRASPLQFEASKWRADLYLRFMPAVSEVDEELRHLLSLAG
jgi:hypothetical protein